MSNQPRLRYRPSLTDAEYRAASLLSCSHIKEGLRSPYAVVFDETFPPQFFPGVFENGRFKTLCSGAKQVLCNQYDFEEGSSKSLENAMNVRASQPVVGWWMGGGWVVDG